MDLLGHKDNVKCGECFPTNTEMFVTGSYDHTVKLWDVKVEYKISDITHSMKFTAPLMSIGVSSDCMTTAIGTSNGIIFGGRKMKGNEEQCGLEDLLGLGSVEEPQRRVLRPTYFRYFYKSQGEKPNEDDYIIW
ncbi:hypothetical protein P3X46_021523 [Hevea brasiliensis]|uniref:Uncharacterized protein n=1 Tax=Hevea brasiliensis TaxID=3981 RepID=A0ABQ9LFW5_HEVBR|nr:hypothetical protein P3X46_021523 [Hevea brasiliensis]